MHLLLLYLSHGVLIKCSKLFQSSLLYFTQTSCISQESLFFTLKLMVHASTMLINSATDWIFMFWQRPSSWPFKCELCILKNTKHDVELPYLFIFTCTSENHSNKTWSWLFISEYWYSLWYLYEIQNYTHQYLPLAAKWTQFLTISTQSFFQTQFVAT